jgi:hypothetical protein
VPRDAGTIDDPSASRAPSSPPDRATGPLIIRPVRRRRRPFGGFRAGGEHASLNNAVSASDRRGGDLIGVDDVVARDGGVRAHGLPSDAARAVPPPGGGPFIRDRTAPKSLALFVDGDETHDLRSALHLSDDLRPRPSAAWPRTDGCDRAATHIQRSLDHGGLVGAQEIRDVGRGRLRRKATPQQPSLAALARLGLVDVPCSLTTTLVITAA